MQYLEVECQFECFVVQCDYFRVVLIIIDVCVCEDKILLFEILNIPKHTEIWRIPN
jgi:hypothetical protein